MGLGLVGPGDGSVDGVDCRGVDNIGDAKTPSGGPKSITTWVRARPRLKGEG